MSSLKDKAIKGIIWSMIERFGNQAIQFFIGLVLARLLMPEDYGLIGMILVFISFAQVFVEGGFPSALIRKKNVTNDDYSTVFWFNFLVALVCYTMLFFSAPFIANFFEEPKLILITRIVGLNIIVSAFGIIQKTILTKELNFKSQATVNLSSILISGLLGLYMAYEGYGVWALVVQNLSRNILMSTVFWFVSVWRPSFIFSTASFIELFKFGSNLLFSALINAVSENLYSIIIGKLYNAKSLGFYTRANQFQKLPVSSIYGAISAVSYPVLAELQNEQQKLKEGYMAMIKMIAFILFPIMAILAAISEPMIHVILTDKWLPSAPILQILCVIGAFYPLHAINLDILKIKGRSDLFLKLEIIKQSLNIAMIVICYRWGVLGLVWGSVVLNFICFYINSYFSKSLINYSTWSQIKDLIKYVIMALFIFGTLLFIKQFPIKPIIYLSVAPFIGVIQYYVIAKIVKIKELEVIKELITKITNKVKPVSV